MRILAMFIMWGVAVARNVVDYVDPYIGTSYPDISVVDSKGTF